MAFKNILVNLFYPYTNKKTWDATNTTHIYKINYYDKPINQLDYPNKYTHGAINNQFPVSQHFVKQPMN